MVNQFWDQDTATIQGVREIGDRFGASLITGNFNGDGFADLAVGVPYEDIGFIVDAGAVNIINGSPTGLTDTGNQIWYQDISGVLGASERRDLFGNSLAAADFNGDGKDDLAVGVRLEDIGSIRRAGAVNVLYGSFNGLTSTGNQIWYQDVAGVLGASERGDQFGTSLAAGDFNGDNKYDLAIGVPKEDIGSIRDAGAVNVLHGSPTGLTATEDQLWYQDATPNVEGAVERGDRFGHSLAAGDFNGDNKDDLAIGVPLEDIGSIRNAGAVNVLYGSFGGLTDSGDQIWYQDVPNILGASERGDLFGHVLATGDFNNDGRDDLAIGVPYEDIGSIRNAGAVNILYGSNNGLTDLGNQIWYQDVAGVSGASERGDLFGASLAVGDFNNDGFDDMAVGVSREDIGTIFDAGAVNILYGSASGLTTTGEQIWYQGLGGIIGTPEANDRFGSSLAAGDFNRDGFYDLAVGVPGENLAGGGTNILYGSATGLIA